MTRTSNKSNEKTLKSAVASKKNNYENAHESSAKSSIANRNDYKRKESRVNLKIDTNHLDDIDIDTSSFDNDKAQDFRIPSAASNIIDNETHDDIQSPQKLDQHNNNDKSKKYLAESDFDLDIVDDAKWDTDIEADKGNNFQFFYILKLFTLF